MSGILYLFSRGLILFIKDVIYICSDFPALLYHRLFKYLMERNWRQDDNHLSSYFDQILDLWSDLDLKCSDQTSVTIGSNAWFGNHVVDSNVTAKIIA